MNNHEHRERGAGMEKRVSDRASPEWGEEGKRSPWDQSDSGKIITRTSEAAMKDR